MITAEPKCKQFLKYSELWRHVRAAISGKPGAIQLIADGSYYGLIEPAYRRTADNAKEVSDRIKSYFGRARFFNATGCTHDKYLGMIGSVPTEVELPTAIEPMEFNVDDSGMTAHDLSLSIASELLITGRAGGLANPPTTAGMAKGVAANVMPSIITYDAEQILWSMGDGKLLEVRLLEGYWKEESKYEWVIEKQVRRLFINDSGNYACEIWRDGKIYEPEVEPIVNGKKIQYIPFQFFGSEKNDATFDRPVMFDLAHQNLGHFQLDCDNRDNLFYHGQGMTNLFVGDPDEVIEANPGGVGVGAKDKNMFGKDDRVELLQLEATGAIPSEMLRDEQRMIMLGAQVVQDKAATQTATGAVIESNASSSQLKRIAINTGTGMTQLFKWCAEFKGTNPDEVIVTVNTKFSTDDLSPQDLQVVFSAVQGSILPKEVFTEAVRKAGITDKTDEQIQDLIENDANGNSEQVASLMLRLEQLEARLSGEDDE